MPTNIRLVGGFRSFPTALAIICGMFALCCPRAQAQQAGDVSSDTSELTLMNLSRVAASVVEIKAVLTTNSGLLVSLKRWVARDAASHGQIVRDEDLTDDAIFGRLETDTQFRSVATALLQQYGYLVPSLNPQSDLAKENEIVVQERGKLLAQREARQEEQLASAAGEPSQNPKKSDTGSSAPSPYGRSGETGQPKSLEPGSPSNGGAGSAPIAQANPAIEDATDVFFPYFTGDTESAGGPAGTNVSLTQAFAAPPSNLDGRPLDGLGGIMGPLGQYGNARPAGIPGSLQATLIEGADEPEAKLPAYDLVATESASGNPPAPAPRSSEMVRRPNPYRDVPSLFDMYVQATPDPENPERFGEEIFTNGTRDSQTIPMDLPAGPDYVVGPGDSLTIDLWGSVAQRLSRTVDREGRVSVPQVGPILVSGKNLSDVQQSVQQALRSQFRDVSADVSLSRLRTVRVYEVGDIAKPGAYDVSSLSTPLSALFVAGGPAPSGSLRILKHYRGNQLLQTVDVYDLLLHGVKADIQRLENGDTILVPTIGPQVTVQGMVRRPAVYELRDEKTLAEVLELAGGLLPVATLRHIEVQRIVDHEKRDILALDISGADGDAAATNQIESFQVHDGDQVRVYPIAPYSENAIFLVGHVLRPGKYSYREGMRVSDLLSSYQDLLPEPAKQHAEIIRLNPPDFRPSVETFDLAAAIENPSQAPSLRPLDTVRIFSRFDFEDPPTVSVGGEVRIPGTYQTPGQIHLVDAIHLAGGLKPGAETDDVQVFRYLPEGTLRIFSVNLDRALNGESAENIVLEPRDQLVIHRNPKEVDPAAVYLQGQVSRPGHYPLSSDMRVSDLIRLGGGLLASADPQTADLTRYEWSGQAALNATNVAISLSSVKNGDANSDLPLHNGDVLTIRQIPGWNDLSATITVKGEVKNPGIYGIRPGERLSSVLQRAGGFAPDAYSYGAVLQRTEVRELESQAQVEMVLRVKDAQSALELLPDKDEAQKQAKDAALQQWQATLDKLTANPALGRVALRIGPDSKNWQNTGADIEVRAGDTLTIPKRPSYVMVTGQVFNATAITYRPGKSAHWYLNQAGGPTPSANRKDIFVIRADGSVAGSKKSLLAGDPLDAPLKAGDTVVVPEKPFGGPAQWQNAFAAAQVASAVASSLFIALRY